MLTAVVTRGTTTQVRLVANASFDPVAEDGEEGHDEPAEEGDHSEEMSEADGEHGAEGAEHGEKLECEFPLEDENKVPITNAGGQICTDPKLPIEPEYKELAWGAGSFIVMTIVMLFLVPKVIRGMKARYDLIEGSKAEADSVRAAAKADVAQYDSSLETVKAEARERVEAARQQLEAERTAKLEEVNAAIAAKRDAANAETLAARHAVQDQVADAVQDVTTRTLELGIGKVPDASKVRSFVDEAMATEVAS